MKNENTRKTVLAWRVQTGAETQHFDNLDLAMDFLRAHCRENKADKVSVESVEMTKEWYLTVRETEDRDEVVIRPRTGSILR